MSDIPAFTDVDYKDPRVLCPTSGEICPSRQNLVELYETKVDDEVMPGLNNDYTNPVYDGAKLNIRLAEYNLRAQLTACAGPEAELCPVREDMDESQVRVSVVRGLRKIMKRNK